MVLAEGFFRVMKTRDERWSAIDDSVQRARALFPMLDSTIWARSLRWARSAEGRRNDVAERIRAKLGTGHQEQEKKTNDRT